MNAALKQITPSAVRMAATTLILAEGSTSTLIVKQFLRNRGYQAYQAEVSKWLFVVALEEDWAINDNGLFRVYYFPTLPALPQ
ncbi:hypothetical protein [Spirosoma fluminis]